MWNFPYPTGIFHIHTERAVFLTSPSHHRKCCTVTEATSVADQIHRTMASILVSQPPTGLRFTMDRMLIRPNSRPRFAPTDHQKLEMVLSFLRSMSCQDVLFTVDKRQFGNGTGLKTLLVSALEELVGKTNQVPRKIKADPREGRVSSIEEELKSQKNEHTRDMIYHQIEW